MSDEQHTEEWRKAVDLRYSISDFGRVRRDIAAGGTFPGRILHPANDRNGYPRVTISRMGLPRKVSVHRWVAEAFLGPCPPGKEVNHKDGDRANPTRSNLEYLTPKENIAHSYRVSGHRRKRNPIGEKHGNSRLNDEKVRSIREEYALGLSTHRSLGKKHGVSPSLVTQVLLRKRWGHVP